MKSPGSVAKGEELGAKVSGPSQLTISGHALIEHVREQD
jgi:hypothetical protein